MELCQPPYLSLNGLAALEVRVEMYVAFEELAHVQYTGGLNIGQQSRDEGLEWQYQLHAGLATHLLFHVAPTRINVLGVLVLMFQ
jgi:hypothetical protein